MKLDEPHHKFNKWSNETKTKTVLFRLKKSGMKYVTQVYVGCGEYTKLGGGFKDFSFSPLFGEFDQFD